jgi:hypothetical protein
MLEVMATSSPIVTRFVAVPQDPDSRLDHDRLQTVINHGFAGLSWMDGGDQAVGCTRIYRLSTG